MNKGDVARLLGIAAAYDQRTVGEGDVEAWYAALGHLNPERAAEAVIEHYRQRRERVMPADVIRIAREIGNARYVDPSAYELLGSGGRGVQAAITGAAPRRVQRPESTRDEDQVQRAALSVACGYCGALPFQHCHINLGRRRVHRREAHPSRVEAGLAT